MTQRKVPERAVRLLHTSDLHLDSQESCALLGATIAAANRLAVDLFLVAGDLFDNSRVTQETVERALQELRRLNMPGVLLPGNHDQLDANSVYHRIDLEALAPELHLITSLEGEQRVFPDLGVVVWGKAMEEHSPSFHPLEGAPPRDGLGWHIGLAHGYHFARGEHLDRASPILPEEIAATGYDYLALGHVHIFRDVSVGPVRAVYSGAPDHAAASPQGGYAALVRLDPNEGVQVERVPLQRTV